MTDPTRPPTPSERRPDDRSRWILYAIFVVLLAIVVVVTLLLLDDDETDEAITVDTTTTVDDTTSTAEPATTTAPATTAEPTTTTAPATTTTAGGADDVARTAVFPFADDDLRFDDPVEAATTFAERIVGFADPVVGDYRAGDARSGEIGVRPVADGPETIVLVRQLDEHWWVLGAVAEGITLDEPATGAELRSPVTVSGVAAAPDGEITVELWTDGAEEPVAIGRAEVATDEPSPFEVVLELDQRPATRDAALYVRSRGPSESGVWEAAVRRVHL